MPLSVDVPSMTDTGKSRAEWSRVELAQCEGTESEQQVNHVWTDEEMMR